MTPQQIKYVLTLAELGSFSKAAQKLYITQPSFSQYIIGIEKQLGVTLFDRSTTPVTLTWAGTAYVEAAQRIQVISDRLRNKLSDLENLQSGSLKIGASTFRTAYLLPKSISKFCKQHPGISVSIVDDNMEQLSAMLKKGEIDILIGTGEYDIRCFDSEELATERLYVAIPPEYPINTQLTAHCLTETDIKTYSKHFLEAAPIALSQLKEQPLILAKQGEFGVESLSALLAEGTFQPETALQVRTIDAAFAFVMSGMGISLIPDTLIKFGNFAAHPRYYALEKSLSQSTISLVLRKNGYLSKAAAAYCLTLKQLVDIGTWRVQQE